MQENRKSERKIKMEKKDRKKYAVLTVISICLCLIGGLLANLAQTDMGNVTKKTILFESASGHTISTVAYFKSYRPIFWDETRDCKY